MMMCTRLKKEPRASLARAAAAMVTAMHAAVASEGSAIMSSMMFMQSNMLQHVNQRVHVYLGVCEGSHVESSTTLQEKLRRIHRYRARKRTWPLAGTARRRRMKRATNRDAHLSKRAECVRQRVR